MKKRHNSYKLLMMGLEISRNAWHARVYKYTLNASYLPHSLCPYFWTMLFTLPLFLIVQTFALPMTLWLLATNAYHKKKYGYAAEDLDLWPCAGMSLLLYLAFTYLGFLFHACYMWASHRLHWKDNETGVLMVTAMAILITGIVLGIRAISLYISDKKDTNPKRNYGAWWKLYGQAYEEYSQESWNLYYQFRDSAKNKNFFVLMGKAISAWYNKNCPIITWK